MHSFIVVELRSQKWVSLGQNEGVGKAGSSEGSRGARVYAPLQLLEAARIPGLGALPTPQCSSNPTALLPRPLVPALSPYKDSCDDIEAMWTIQDSLPISRSLTKSHLEVLLAIYHSIVTNSGG